MDLTDIVNKTCVIGLSYFDLNDEPLKQNLLAGRVVKVHEDDGISVNLNLEDPTDKEAIFTLPSSLAPWFNAPKGAYRNQDNKVLIEDPDFLVTWDVHRTKEDKKDGQSEWWDWIPRVAPPSVG
ncbi:hypothetical protein A9Q99_13755 [Gammaproteobacteria bacterium 45_16_T64]|nr:hypothetical protein A9Q99_13755 [Gammaproteobacteria bacterium 45_16_T64]